MLNVDTFRNSIKFENPIGYIEFLLNVYSLSGELNIDTNNGKFFRKIFNVNPENAGDISIEDKNKFINSRLIVDYMKNKDMWSTYVEMPEGEEKKQLNVAASTAVSNEINVVENYLVLDSSKLLSGEEQGSLDHEFSLSVKASDVFKVARAIYELGRDNGIDFYMILPRLNQLKGVSDNILINSSTASLEGTLRLLDMLPDEYKALSQSPCGFGVVVDGWLGYQSHDPETNMSMSSLVGKHIFSGLDKGLLDVYKTIDVDGETEMWLNAFVAPDAEDLDKVRIELLNRLKAKDEELFRSLIPYVVNELEANGINLEHMFLAPSVAADLHVQYGSIQVGEPVDEKIEMTDVPAEDTIDVSELFKKQDESVIAVPKPEFVFEGLDKKDEKIEGEFDFSSLNTEVPSVEERAESVPVGNEGFLNDAEIDSLNVNSFESGVSVTVDPANRVKYNEIGISDELLDTLVKNEKLETVTLYQFLEDGKVLHEVPVNSRVVIATDIGEHSSGNEVLGADFIAGPIVHYATKIGETSVKDIISRYAIEIKEEELKKGFFSSLFGKK